MSLFSEPSSSSSSSHPHPTFVSLRLATYRLLQASLVLLLLLCLVLCTTLVLHTRSNKWLLLNRGTSVSISSSLLQGEPPRYAPSDLPNVLTPPVPLYPASTLPGQVTTATLLYHLSGLYEVAILNQNNRAIGNPGFNASITYLLQQIREHTNLVNVERSYFDVLTGTSYSNIAFTVLINNTIPRSLQLNTDFLIYVNSASGKRQAGQYLPTIYVLNGGCEVQNWADALGGAPPSEFYGLVQRIGSCAEGVRIGNAQLFGAAGLMVVSSAGPVRAVAPSTISIPAVSISANIGQALITAISAGGSSAVGVTLSFETQRTFVTVSNICGDTPAGDPTSVVLVGGHSDGVAAGPGMNDDGSGTTSTLTLAIAMTRLMNNASLNYKPVNMVKFCWFGAEERGLLGSAEVVRQGILKNNDPAARVGSRARDWAIMLDLDMLGSLNFQHFFYDANTYVPVGTPASAIQGSKIMSNMLLDFFVMNNLPSNSELFDGRSDYGPFLAAGIPSGGVEAGADAIKSEAERVRYLAATGWGGIAGVINDQCYHRACDTIGNIHWSALTNQTMAAARVIELLALRPALRQYLGNPVNQTQKLRYDHLPFEYRYSLVERESDGRFEFHF